jgi:hypothetical protein
MSCEPTCRDDRAASVAPMVWAHCLSFEQSINICMTLCPWSVVHQRTNPQCCLEESLKTNPR